MTLEEYAQSIVTSGKSGKSQQRRRSSTTFFFSEQRRATTVSVNVQRSKACSPTAVSKNKVGGKEHRMERFSASHSKKKGSKGDKSETKGSPLPVTG